jgi:hypothetical protein
VAEETDPGDPEDPAKPEDVLRFRDQRGPAATPRQPASTPPEGHQCFPRHLTVMFSRPASS